MNTIMRLLALFVLFPLLSPTPAAQTVMPWRAADAGGAQRSVGAAMTLRSSVAQTCAGRASEVPHQVVTGFLAVTAAGGGGQPVMEVLPDPLAFGTIAIGASGTQVLTVRNTGTGPLRIIGMTVTPAVYSLVSGHGARNINPGASATVELRFTPAAEGPVDGTLRIESNWEGHPFVDVTLTGSGLREAADLVFSETSIDFGDVTLGLAGRKGSPPGTTAKSRAPSATRAWKDPAWPASRSRISAAAVSRRAGAMSSPSVSSRLPRALSAHATWSNRTTATSRGRKSSSAAAE